MPTFTHNISTLPCTCCICGSLMAPPTTNEHWPCCDQKCEDTYCDILFEQQQQMDDLTNRPCPKGWDHL